MRHHRWDVRPLAVETRVVWTCKHCGTQAETPAYASNPSAVLSGECFKRAPGGQWERYLGRLGVACAPC